MKDRLYTSFYFFFTKITCPHKWAVKKYIAFLALNTYLKQPYSPTNLVIASSSSSSLFFFQRILDKEVFIMDLAKANEAGPDQRPTYSKLYDARKDLEMTTLFPKDFDAVVNRMVVDEDYYAKYFRWVIGLGVAHNHLLYLFDDRSPS